MNAVKNGMALNIHIKHSRHFIF